MDARTQEKTVQKFISFFNNEEHQHEKQYAQQYLQSLLSIFRTVSPDYISFEHKVKSDNGKSQNYIDAYLPKVKTFIEMKDGSINLDKRYMQSNGLELTPFEQCKRYADNAIYSEKPRYIIVSNFKTIRIHDLEDSIPHEHYQEITLDNFAKDYRMLEFLADPNKEKPRSRELEISMKAGELVGKLYDALLRNYADPNDPKNLHSLNVLCVRIVFCLYAEDADLFNRDAFHDYLCSFKPSNARTALKNLFTYLDTKPEDRDPYENEELKVFPYVNGGLFKQDPSVELPPFTDEIVELIKTELSENFDWSDISPTIFGAVFESTLNPETRRSGGMHYTSIENIHKVIDPLFLDDLKAELEKIKNENKEKKQKNQAINFQKKLASLVFLDPAAGSGNFLTETYLSLRRLENEALRIITKGATFMDFGEEFSPILVKIHQFYGIEINDFAVSVAKTALWIAEAQTMKESEKILDSDIDFFPLKSISNYVEGNALRMNWEDVVPKEKLNYIIGNPPFVGARLKSKDQKQDILDIFTEKWKNWGNLDYVSCWFKRASDLMKNTEIRSALVATNSICQGESVSTLWQNLINEGLKIDFAWRTFRWDSEASIKAHVHCVIVGFSYSKNKNRIIFNSDGSSFNCNNINAYLVNANNSFIDNMNKPICDVPEGGIGNQPIDDGNYLFSYEEMKDFISKEPKSKSYFRPWYGAVEFIKQKPRYCLWLGNCSPSELKTMPNCLERVLNVKNFRLKSKRAQTLKLADTPTRFCVENLPKDDFIVIPEISSEKRKYIPLGFMSPNNMCSNRLKLIPNASIYHFGILTSIVHMAWMRTVCGRLEMRYCYSIGIVYNNFPWCTPTDAQKAKIEQTAQGILDARALFPDSSLADLYDELTMPIELRKAHQANDRAVMEAYGFDKDLLEEEIVAKLFDMYAELTKKEKTKKK